MSNFKIWLAQQELKTTVLGDLMEIVKFSCSSDNNHLFLLTVNQDLFHAELEKGSNEATFSILYHNVIDFSCSLSKMHFVARNGLLFESECSNLKNAEEMEVKGNDEKIYLRAISCFRSENKNVLYLVDTSHRLWAKEDEKLRMIEFARDNDKSPLHHVYKQSHQGMAITSGVDFCVVLRAAYSSIFESCNEDMKQFREITSTNGGNIYLHTASCPCVEGYEADNFDYTYENVYYETPLSEEESKESVKPKQVLTSVCRSHVLTGKSAVYVGQLLLDTEVWAFGNNRRGQLGVGDQVPRQNGAVCIRQLRCRGLKHLASGSGHSVAVAIDGKAWAWGDDSLGQLGSLEVLDNTSCPSVSSPRAVSWPVTMGRVVNTAAGDNHTVLLTDSGTIVTMGKCVSHSTLKTAALDFSSVDENKEPLQVFASGDFSVCVYSSVPLRRMFPELSTLINRWQELFSKCHTVDSELFPLVPSSPLNEKQAMSGFSPQREEFDLVMQAVTEGHHRILALVALTVESLVWYEKDLHLGHEVGCESIAPISHCGEYVKVYRTYLEAVCDLVAMEGFRNVQHYSTVSVQQIKSLLPGERDERIVTNALFMPLSHQKLYLDLMDTFRLHGGAEGAKDLMSSPSWPRKEGKGKGKTLSVPDMTSLPASGPMMHCSRSETVSLCSVPTAPMRSGEASPRGSSQSITNSNDGASRIGSEEDVDAALAMWRSLIIGQEWARAHLRAQSTREFWEDQSRGRVVLEKWQVATAPSRGGDGEGGCCHWQWCPRVHGQRVVRESWVGGRAREVAPSLWVARPATLFMSVASASAYPSPSSPSFVLLNDALLQVAPNGIPTAHSLSTLWVEPLRDSWEQDQQIPQNALKMTVPEDSLTVVASSAEERMAWLKSLNSAIIKCLCKESPALMKTSLDVPPASRNASHLFLRHAVYRNAVYSGGWLHGRPHGKGVLEWPDERRIEGMFQKGVVSGHAVHVQPSVGTYEGQWKDGIYHGYGVMRYTSGAVYEGEWRGGLPEGHGMRKEGHFLSSVACVYVGDWVAGCKHGYGVMDDILKGQKYLGMWEKDEKSGSGLIVSLDGIYHEGTFVRGSISGHGVMILEEGTHYEGELKGIGVFGGRGRLTLVPGGHSLEGLMTGSWDSGIKVNNGTFHFQRAPMSPVEQPHPLLSTSPSTPRSFGKLCVPPLKKWKSLFQLCREQLGLKGEEDDEDYIFVSESQFDDLKKYRKTESGFSEVMRVWDNVAVAITRSQLHLKQKLQQQQPYGKSTAADGICREGIADDGIITIPDFGRKCLDKKSYKETEKYLMKATESCHHPLGRLVASLASAFNATYGGVRVHPLLLPHAVSELSSLTVRLYAICRLLFPALPPHHMEVILLPQLDSQSLNSEGAEEEEELVVTSAGLLHPMLLPRVHSSLFVLYALHNKAEDDKYWQRLLKWNKRDSTSLMSFLEVQRKFWACASIRPTEEESCPPLSSPPPSPTHPKHDHTFGDAVETLQQLKTTFCPLEKLQVIHRTFERMIWTIQNVLGTDFQQLGMDDLFPLFHFIVVKAQILQLGSEIHFVEDFMDSHLRNGELGMMFTTLKACYCLILQEKVG